MATHDLVHVGVRIPRWMRAQLKAHVALNGTNVEAVLRRLIEMELAKQPVAIEGTPS